MAEKSAEWLHDIGVYTYGDLQNLGAPLAYHLIKSQYPRTTAVLLYALEGALQNRHWNSFTREEKKTHVSIVMCLISKQNDLQVC